MLFFCLCAPTFCWASSIISHSSEWKTKFCLCHFEKSILLRISPAIICYEQLLVSVGLELISFSQLCNQYIEVLSTAFGVAAIWCFDLVFGESVCVISFYSCPLLLNHQQSIFSLDIAFIQSQIHFWSFQNPFSFTSAFEFEVGQRAT